MKFGKESNLFGVEKETGFTLNYDKYNWTYFDPEAKKKRHETVFPEEKKKAFALGAEMVKGKV